MRMSEKEFQKLLAAGKIKIHEQSVHKQDGSMMKDTAITDEETTTKESKKKRKGKTMSEFQSTAEKVYYQEYIEPLILTGEITSCDMHKRFDIVPAVKWGNVQLRTKRYTPDFVLTFRNGSIKVVEIKGKVIKKLQRDYPLRRQLFILNFCIPNNWEFEEIEAEMLTAGLRKKAKM